MGPCINLVFTKLLEAGEQTEIVIMLKRDQNTRSLGKTDLRIDDIDGGDFRFDGRAFVYGFGYDCSEKIEDTDSIYRNVKINGDAIVMELGLCAMSNQSKDHKILASLAIDILEKYEGYVDIDNYEEFAKPLTAFDDINAYHIEGVTTFVDLKFLRNWVKHPEFRLIK